MNFVLGRGEIGSAVIKLLTDAGLTVESYDVNENRYPLFKKVDILHVCFPYNNSFIENLEVYIKGYKPEYVIIWSTVPIGTTKKFKNAIHSPVEGKHPDLDKSIKFMVKWLGCNTPKLARFAHGYFEDSLNLEVNVVRHSDWTEALKLLSTTEYGINIEFARYKKAVTDSLKMDYQLCKDWNEDYNELYYALGLGNKYQKFNLDAPSGPKGGHCVTPNAKLLHEAYPSIFTRIVGEIW